ncbi:MAG: hypothetical protein ABW360_13735 [Phenylobacterium sp.]
MIWTVAALAAGLQVTAEPVNATDRPLPAGNVRIDLDCRPALRRMLVLSPAAPTRFVAIPKAAKCRASLRALPAPTYACHWDTTFSPANAVGGQGDTITLRYTLVCGGR